MRDDGNAGQGAAPADRAAAMDAIINAPSPQAKAVALDNWERMNMAPASSPPPRVAAAVIPARPATGGAPSDTMAAAVRDAQTATTPQQKAVALARIEQLSLESVAGVAPKPGAAASVQDAMARLDNAPTPPERRAALDELEAAHLNAPQDEPFVDFPAPQSASEYQFTVPPGGSAIVNDEGVGAIKAALFDAGVPSEFANLAFQNAARNHAAGVLASDQAYEAAALSAKATVEKQLGADAPATLKLAVDYLNDLLAERPALQEAIDLAMVDPWALMQAANLARSRRVDRASVGAPNAAEAARIKATLAAADAAIAANRRAKESRESVERVHAALSGRR